MTPALPVADVQLLLLNPVVQSVREMAVQHGGNAYLVGGAVRDWLRTGQLPADLDFTLIDCKAAKLAKQLADGQHGHLVPLDWDLGIHRVVLPAAGVTVDLSDALDNDLARDLARRDLTINAIALDLQSGALIDPFEGQVDLAQRRVRMISEANLLDDPLRLLRVFRMAAVIQAQTIDEATLAVVRRHGAKLWESAAERIQYEWFRLLSITPCFSVVAEMAQSGLLEVLMPELVPMRAIPSSGFHHLGLFEHTLELVRQTERLLPECPPKAREHLYQPIGGHFTRLGMVKLACLLHDVGKPATLGRKEDPIYGERLTFYGHEEVGEAMADAWLKRLKASNEIRVYLKKLVRWHLYPCQFGPDSPRKSLLRFYRRMGEETVDVTLLALADRHSALGPWLKESDLQASHQRHLWLMENYEAEQSVLRVPRLLNGHEVMQILGIGPGPHLKEILEALQEAQQLQEVTTPAEAQAWLQSRFKPD